MSFPALEELVKHRRGMLLIDEVLSCDDDKITTQLTITKNSLFLQNDHVPAWVGVEYAAQSVAALSGMRARKQSEESKLGLLLSCRRYKSNRSKFMIGERLVIEAVEEFNDGQMGAYSCSISMNGEAIASLSLNAYIPDNINNIRTLGR